MQQLCQKTGIHNIYPSILTKVIEYVCNSGNVHDSGGKCLRPWGDVHDSWEMSMTVGGMSSTVGETSTIVGGMSATVGKLNML